MASAPRLHLFQGFGVELEYMVVDASSLAVKPISDKIIFNQVGAYVSDVELGQIAWSNELVLHVIELKTNGPAADLEILPALFQEHINKINQILTGYGARLLPTGMHPIMNPATDTEIWPHEYNAVYEAYNRVFDCRGHGWSNLQSTHLNLPFATDDEFGRLHAAIRLLLPIIPALSASSPLMDGQFTSFASNRLNVYSRNQQQIFQIAGHIIPEPVFSQAAYEQEILLPIYKAIAPYDPENILQEEFLNSRGAIARFERNAIEIRIIDNQECPLADMSILHLIVKVLQLLVNEKCQNYNEQKKWATGKLAFIYNTMVQQGMQAEIKDLPYLQLFGIDQNRPMLAQEVWQHLLKKVQDEYYMPASFLTALQLLLQEGNLSNRIKQALGSTPTKEDIQKVYLGLADCLAEGKMFRN